LDEQASIAVLEIVKADPPEPRTRGQWLENPFGEVVHLDRCACLRREHQLIGDVGLALGEGLDQPIVRELEEGTPELSAYVDAGAGAGGRTHAHRPPRAPTRKPTEPPPAEPTAPNAHSLPGRGGGGMC